MKVTEAAEILGVHVNTVGSWMAQGVITYSKTPGGQRQPHAESVLAILQGRVQGPADDVVADQLDQMAQALEERATKLRRLADELREH